MESVLQNIVLEGSNLDDEENLATDSDRVKAPVVGASSTNFGGSQKHDVANQASGDRVVSLALTAFQKTSDEVEGVNQASMSQVRLLWRLSGQISGNDELEQHSLDTLEQRMASIEEVVTSARNVHTMVKNDHVVIMSYLRRILKSRQKNKEAKAAFQSELEKTTMQAGGQEKTAQRKEWQVAHPTTQ